MPTDRNDPVDPIERIEPLEPIDRIDPVDPTDSRDPLDPVDRIDPAEKSEPKLRTENAERAEATLPTLRLDHADQRERDERHESDMVGTVVAGAVAATVRPMASTAPMLRPSIKNKAPGLRFERELWERGVEVVAGIDEVGRGSWAGPLTLAAVVVPRHKRLNKVRDSKMLTEDERELMHDRVLAWAAHASVAHASQVECDELGMSAAQRLAAQRALAGLGIEVDHVLVDGNWDFVETLPTTRIVRGDAVSLSIAAASIVAKVTRDRLMRAWDLHHPAYGFVANKGYPCPRHKAALAAYGPSAIHRRRWVFMDELRWTGIPRLVVDEDDAQLGLF